MTPAHATWLRRCWPAPAFILLFIACLLLQWPMARLLAPRAETALPGAAVEHLRGSVWSAHARGLHLAGMRWPEARLWLAPTALLRGQPALRHDFGQQAPPAAMREATDP